MRARQTLVCESADNGKGGRRHDDARNHLARRGAKLSMKQEISFRCSSRRSSQWQPETRRSPATQLGRLT